MSSSTKSPSCFVFSSKFDADIYRWLMTNHRDELDRIKEEAIEWIESWKKEHPDGAKIPGWLHLTISLDNGFKGFFGKQSPLEIWPIDGTSKFVDDIFGDLLGDAVARCDFHRIAEAYLAGVELPPYGSDSDDDCEDDDEAVAASL